MKWAHEIVGMPSPTDNHVICRIREAAKRILGSGRPNRKEPLSTDILKDFVEGAELRGRTEKVGDD